LGGCVNSGFGLEMGNCAGQQWVAHPEYLRITRYLVTGAQISLFVRRFVLGTRYGVFVLGTMSTNS